MSASEEVGLRHRNRDIIEVGAAIALPYGSGHALITDWPAGPLAVSAQASPRVCL